MEINFTKAELLATAVKKQQYPKAELPEMAFAGRSNVGKSSLINRVVNRKSLARTSSTPGKTATINFYNIDGKMNLVDLPGYGYAKVSKSEKERWGKMIDEFLHSRETLAQVIQLVDIRHKPSAEDVIMADWIRGFDFFPIVVATKLDKIKKSQINSQLDLIRDTLKLEEGSIIIPFSAETGQGKDELHALINKIITEVTTDENS